MSPTAIMRLGLRGNAHKAALELKSQHPDVVFSSGRRTRREQARAMAKNIVLAGRSWIRDTYKSTEISNALQRWVDDNPRARTRTEITEVLVAAMALFKDAELISLSKHFTGDAFDVVPVEGLSGVQLLNTLRAVVHKYGGKLIEKEGGVRVWHAQFPA